MAVFVHLTSHRNLAAIRRAGIRVEAGRGGVYAMPVTRNFQIAHQWLRELKRGGGGTIMGVYFRVPDELMVQVGHYASLKVEMTAAEAVGLIMAAEGRDPGAARVADAASRAVCERRRLPSSPEGFEVVIPRGIAAGEILRVKALPQVTGWRYRPGANGTAPCVCVCVCCEKGSYGVRKLVRSVDADEARGRARNVTIFGRD